MIMLNVKFMLSFLLTALFISGCGITDERIQEIIGGYQGTSVDTERTLDNQRFRISPSGASGIGIGIGIGYLNPASECEVFGWAQVIREKLDDEIVLNPTVINDPVDEQGKREQWSNHITDDGYHVDGFVPGNNAPTERDIYHPNTGNGFNDDPNMPNNDIENNRQVENARLYILEAETCVRCLNPKGPYFACFNWIYTKVKNGREETFIYGFKRSPEDNDFPSDSFNRAVNEWSGN